jgi:hypothetical protein
MSGLLAQCQPDSNKVTAYGLLSTIQNLEVKFGFQLRILEDSLNRFLLSPPVLVSTYWPLLCAGQFAAMDRSRGMFVDVDDVLPMMPSVSGNPSYLVYYTPVYMRYATPAVFFSGLRVTKGVAVAGSGAFTTGANTVGRVFNTVAQYVPSVVLPPDYVTPKVVQARQWLKAKL